MTTSASSILRLFSLLCACGAVACYLSHERDEPRSLDAGGGHDEAASGPDATGGLSRCAGFDLDISCAAACQADCPHPDFDECLQSCHRLYELTGRCGCLAVLYQACDASDGDSCRSQPACQPILDDLSRCQDE